MVYFQNALLLDASCSPLAPSIQPACFTEVIGAFQRLFSCFAPEMVGVKSTGAAGTAVGSAPACKRHCADSAALC